jgi:hypothetical protein
MPKTMKIKAASLRGSSLSAAGAGAFAGAANRGALAATDALLMA